MNVNPRPMWGPGLLAVAVLCTVYGSGVARGASPQFSGYLKSYAEILHYPDYGLASAGVNPPPVGAVANRFRMQGRYALAPSVTLDVAYEIESRTQDHALFDDASIAGFAGRFYRAGDMDRRLYPAAGDTVGSFALYQNLDRAELRLRIGRLDVDVGRQAIAWGSARVVNPTDVLSPFTYDALDTEDRVGVDAVRARVTLGYLSEIDMGWVVGDDFKTANSAAYVRYRTHAARTDVTATAIGFRQHLLVGCDLARAIGGAGVWCETARVWPRRLAGNIGARPPGYWRLSLGGDYSLGANTYGFIEYHYNQSGASDPGDYAAELATPAYVDGAVYLLGEHYLAPGISHQLTPLITTGAEMLYNLSDASAYLHGSIDYNLAENVFLAGGGYFSIGRAPSPGEPFRSEFGSYPRMFYTSFRYYF